MEGEGEEEPPVFGQTSVHNTPYVIQKTVAIIFSAE